MLRYETLDGKIFEGEVAEDLATSLWQSQFCPEPTLEEWMQGIARRVAMWNGSILRTSNVDLCIDDLVTCGFLKKV